MDGCLVCGGTSLADDGGACPECLPDDDLYLPEGLSLQPNGRYWAVCRSCRGDFEWEGELNEFDPDMAYCFGSERCLP